MTSNWTCYKHEEKPIKKTLRRTPTEDHPLKKTSLKPTSKLSQTRNAPSDPLSMALDGFDPLSIYSDDDDYTLSLHGGVKSKENDWIEHWQSRRAAILTKYTTAEKLSIISSFLPGGEKVIMKTQTIIVDQVKTRLEQLDDFEEGSVRQMLNLSQQEYVSRIDMLNRELVQAWNSEQRVKALKIAIQCSKLLVDTSVMQFYPSKFVLITDILDIFGKLVYDRLRNKAQYLEPSTKRVVPLPENFTPDMVPEAAKETCQNWLYKMASIRELVPRLYIEMSLLKCYSFLTHDEFGSALLRITSMIRGIGHPLIAVYARFYLCRVGLTVHTASKDFFLHNIDDFLLTYPQVFNKNITSELTAQQIDISKYISLYSPALDWLLYGLVEWSNVSSSILDKLVEQCQSMKNSDLLLRSIMSSCKPDYVTCRAMQFLDLICQSGAEDAIISDMVVALGQRVCCGGRSADDKKLLSSVWRVMRRFKNQKHFLACAEPWVQFTAMNFSAKQIDWLLGDILDCITKPGKPVAEYYIQILAILKKISLFTPDMEELLTQEHLLPTLELFDAGPYLMDICKAILTAYQSQQNYIISDDVLISNLMQICLLLHESINSFTVDDELKNVSELVCRFIKSVSYGKEFQRQLKFYTEVRATFFKLDTIYVILIQLVNNLSMTVRSLIVGKDSQKVGNFVRCCSAYCFITVPSVICPFTKVQLYLLSGQVALINQCFLQAEDCFKAALNALSNVPPKRMIDGQLRSTDAFLVSYISNFMSTLLILPDRQQGGNFLYMFKGLLMAINRLPWDPTNPSRYTLLLKSIDLLSHMVQEDYIYHAGEAIANDSILTFNPNFTNEVNKVCALIIDEILSILKQMGENNDNHKQSALALELFWRVVRRGDTSVREIEKLALNLWNLAHKHKNCVDYKMSNKLLAALELEDKHSRINPNILARLKLSKVN